MTLIQPPESPPTLKQTSSENHQHCIPDTVLLETSYDENFGSCQTECSKIPEIMCDFPILTPGMVSAPPLLDELHSDSDASSLEESFSSQESSFCCDNPNENNKRQHTTTTEFQDCNSSTDCDDNIEVHLDINDADSFYTAIMETHSSPLSSRSPSPATTTAATAALEKRVRFSTAEIRDYNVIVGDHPSCAAGLPLSLDWTYNPISRTIQLQDDNEGTATTGLSSSSSSCNLEKSHGVGSKVQRLDLLQRMKILKQFYKSQDLWMAERERRKVLEEELEQEAARCVRSHVAGGSLCGCEEPLDDDDVDDYYLETDVDAVVPYRHADDYENDKHYAERTVLQTTASCDVLQCLAD